jgi:hypothetical protein
MNTLKNSTLDTVCEIKSAKQISSIDFSQIVINSRQNFNSLFKDAIEIYGVTYSDSPELLYDFFKKKNLQRLELVVGDAEDYREKLQGNPILAEELEQLKSSGKLILYVSNKMIHAKFFFIKTIHNTLKVVVTSANLTKNAQDASYQKNIADVFNNVHLKKYDWLKHIFQKNFDELKSFASLFMEDLTEIIQQNPEKEKREIIIEWIQNDTQSQHQHQVALINQDLVKKALSTREDDIEFIMDVKSLPKELRKNANLILSQYKNIEKKQEQRYSIHAKHFLEERRKQYGIPDMYIDEDKHIVQGIQPGLILTGNNMDPDELNDSLEHIESFIETVDTLGHTNNTLYVKAHMFEALLYFLYAPFSNWHIKQLKIRDAADEKPFPHLYIYGESNAGKGTLASFALRLISNGIVTTAVDAQEITPGKLRDIKIGSSTCFPLPLDDITSKKLNSLDDIIRNYYKNWSFENIFPALIFITNNRTPQPWMKNRVKFLTFDVRFDRSPSNTSQVNKIIKKQNDVFKALSYIILNEIDSDLVLEKDFLAPIRRAMIQLYEKAGRSLPDYFPSIPAEQRFDINKEMWKKLYTQNMLNEEMKKDHLILQFNTTIESWALNNYLGMLPRNIRANKMGQKIIVKNPEQFFLWLPDKERNQGTLTNLIKSFIKR